MESLSPDVHPIALSQILSLQDENIDKKEPRSHM
jgi:hypothetical protein